MFSSLKVFDEFCQVIFSVQVCVLLPFSQVAMGDEDEVPCLGEWECVACEQTPDDDSLCVICRKKPRAKKQQFCYRCLGEIKAAERDAKAESKEALRDFKRLRREGGKPFQNYLDQIQVKMWFSWPWLFAPGLWVRTILL